MYINPLKSTIFAIYEADIQMRDRIEGGTPMRPDLIKGWLSAKAGVDKQWELHQALIRTVQSLGVEVAADATNEQMEEALEKLTGQRNTVGFKRDMSRGGELYVETRIIKSGLKEVTNIMFAGSRWGATKKGPKSFLAERVFPQDDPIFLGITEPSGVDLFIGHITGKDGPTSNLTMYEYVTQPRFTVQLKVTLDAIQYSHWPMIWEQFQEIGLGALRSQGFGRFNVHDFKWIGGYKRGKAAEENETGDMSDAAIAGVNMAAVEMAVNGASVAERRNNYASGPEAFDAAERERALAAAPA